MLDEDTTSDGPPTASGEEHGHRPAVPVGASDLQAMSPIRDDAAPVSAPIRKMAGILRSTVTESAANALCAKSGLREAQITARDRRATRAVVYIWYSERMETPNSLARREQDARAYAARMGLTVVRVCCEPMEAGRALENRRVLHGLLDDLGEDGIGHIIVEASDRFDRSFEVLGEFLGLIKRLQVSLHDVTRGTKLTPAEMDIAARLVELDRNRAIVRMQDGIAKSALAGRPMISHCYGYGMGLDDRNRRVFHVMEDEAEVIREIFEMYNSGVPVSTIIRILNADPAKQYRNGNWNRSLILGSAQVGSGILRRVRYTGRQTYRRTITTKEGGRTKQRLRDFGEWLVSPVMEHLRIIDVEVFDTAQRLLEDAAERFRARDAIVEAFTEKSPTTLEGCGVTLFDKYARSKKARPPIGTNRTDAERAAILKKVQELNDGGMTLADTSDEVGVRLRTLLRWRKIGMPQELLVKKILTVEERIPILRAVEKLVASGRTLEAAAAQVGIPLARIIYWRNREDGSRRPGVRKKRRKASERDAILQRFRELCDAGMRYRNAAAEVGVSYGTIYNWTKAS